ncbi:hypothetical protein TH0630_03810 [Helicobacter pylori]
MGNNENHEKLSGILRSSQEGVYNEKTKELDLGKLYDNIKETTQMPMVNILLMGAVGVGKSSLINGLFGQEVAKIGIGKPVTQHLKKYVDEEKGLILWDTKGIEAADYHDTMQSIKQRMEEVSPSKGHDEKEAEEKIIHMAYLCILESYPRVEEELLSFAKDWNIPTIVVFTHTQAEAGEAFVQESKGIIDEEWGCEVPNR